MSQSREWEDVVWKRRGRISLCSLFFLAAGWSAVFAAITFFPLSMILQGCGTCAKGVVVTRDLVSTGIAHAIPRTKAYPKERKAIPTQLCGQMEFRPLDQPLAQPLCKAVTTTYVTTPNEVAAMDSAMYEYPIGSTRRFFVRLETLECLDQWNEENEFLLTRWLGIGLVSGLWPLFLMMTYYMVRGIQVTYSWGWFGRSYRRLVQWIHDKKIERARQQEERETERQETKTKMQREVAERHLRLMRDTTVKYSDTYVERAILTSSNEMNA